MTVLSLPSPASSARRPPAAPRWATPRQPDRLTYGPAVGHIATTLGRPLRPWQQQVADVALEVDATTGRLAYKQVILTVPRQQGKSTLLLAVMVHRMIGMHGLHGRQTVNYAAQNALSARKKFLKDFANALQTSVLGSQVQVYKGMGQAGFTFSNGSSADVVSGTEKSGHGDVLDLGIVDEAFAQPDARLEQAFRPAMSTRQEPQQWIVSTAGGADSTYFRKKIDFGRSLVESGRTTTTAYFEWSAPDDADPHDPHTWWSCMPSLGFGVTEATIQSDLDDLNDLDQFRRAYLNQWLDGKTAEQVIDPQHWKACADPGGPGDPGMQLDDAARLALAVDVSPSRNQAAIAVAGLTTFGSPGIEVVDTDEGTEWVVPRLRELRASLGPAVLALDGAGPAASLIPDLIEAGWKVATAAEVQRDGATGQLVTAARGEVVAACGQLYDAAVARRLRHRAQPVLNTALAGAAKRPVGDAWAWGRRQSAADITPLMATTVALWAHTRFIRAGLQPVNPLLTVF